MKTETPTKTVIQGLCHTPSFGHAPQWRKCHALPVRTEQYISLLQNHAEQNSWTPITGDSSSSFQASARTLLWLMQVNNPCQINGKTANDICTFCKSKVWNWAKSTRGKEGSVPSFECYTTLLRVNSFQSARGRLQSSFQFLSVNIKGLELLAILSIRTTHELFNLRKLHSAFLCEKVS